MIDNGIHINPHSLVVASSDHISELLTVASSALELVADWLITLPPRPPGGTHDGVLVRGRYLDGGKSIGSEESLTFFGNFGPFPFKQMNSD